MAIKLTKEEKTKREVLLKDLHSAWEHLESAQAEAEDKIKVILEDLNNGPLNDYYEALANAETFREGVAERLREEYDGKTDSWQEGEKGQEAATFLEEWESIALETSLTITPPDFDISEGGDVIEVFENLSLGD